MSYNFEVYNQNKLLFHSDGHWLHPIFEFEEFLKTSPLKPEALEIHDKIIGRAAALLLVRLGIKKLHAKLLSELGKDVLEHYNVDYNYEKMVPQIGCQTEEQLRNEYNPEVAFKLIQNRIKIKHQTNI